MLQWVVCVRDQPVGLISLSHIDLQNSRAEFSIGLPNSTASGVAHKACLLALHHTFFGVGLNKLFGYIYDGNEQALHAATRLGFREEGYLSEHFRLPPHGYVGVHAVGLTRQQALETPSLVRTVRRRLEQDWPALA
jgi:RimJ/RimL family protein N-acetyltransferase